MVQVNEINYATSIGVLFALKEMHGFKTLQETYKLFENADIDVVIEVLTVAYNKQNGTNMSVNDFVNFLGEKGIGFLAMTDVFQTVVEAIMFDGLTPEQKALKKKMMVESKL